MFAKFAFAVLIPTLWIFSHCEASTPGQTSLLFVANLIKDWSQKHPISNNVVVLNTGQTSESVSFFLEHVTQNTPTILANASNCKNIEARESIVIISSHVFNDVNLSLFWFFIIFKYF